MARRGGRHARKLLGLDAQIDCPAALGARARRFWRACEGEDLPPDSGTQTGGKAPFAPCEKSRNLRQDLTDPALDRGKPSTRVR
jgi:hypothetical protein